MGTTMFLLLNLLVGIADVFAIITYVFGRDCYNMIIGEENFERKTVLYTIIFAIATIIILVGTYILTPLGLLLWAVILIGLLCRV